MIKRIFPAVLAVLGCYLPMMARGADTLEQTGSEHSTLDFSGAQALSTVEASVLIHSLPMTTLLDGRSLPLTNSLGRMGMAPLDLFPAAYLTADVPTVSTRPRYESDASGKVAELRLPEYYYGGETGIFYGKSTGKYGGEQFGSYFIGTVGNDKVQITAGASYQESTLHFQRRSR